MIELLTRRRIRARRDALYQHVVKDACSMSLHHLEEIMRSIHIINLKLLSYDSCPQKEPEEIFKDA